MYIYVAIKWGQSCFCTKRLNKSVRSRPERYALYINTFCYSLVLLITGNFFK